MNKHEILVGPYRSGKTTVLIEHALNRCLNKTTENRGKLDQSSETVIIVPSQRYRKLVEKRLKNLIDKCNFASATTEKNEQQERTRVTGLWGLKIQTIYQFCQEHLLQAGIFIKLLPQGARAKLVAAICEDFIETGKAEAIARLPKSKSTYASILELFDEWQRSGYDSQSIIDKTRLPRAQVYQKELAQIYAQYQQSLKTLGYTDQHGIVLQFTHFLNKQNTKLHNLIIVDGFDRFNLMQIQLLEALAKRVEQINVSFDYEEPQDSLFEEYDWKIRNFEQIKNLLTDTYVFTDQPALPLITPCNKEIITASDRLSEMAIIAARIKAAIVLDDIKADEIVVAARNIDPYKSAIHAAFKDAGLEYRIDEAFAINSLPIIRLLISLLSLKQDDFKRRRVIDCLRSPYFKLAALSLKKPDIEKLNSISVDKKVIAGKEQWLQAFNGHYLNNGLSKLFDLLAQADTFDSAIDYVTWVENLIDEALNTDAINDHQDPVSIWKQKEAISQFRRQLAQLIQEEEILKTIKRNNIKQPYFERLFELLETANFAAPAPGPNQILITNAELVPNCLFKQIYLAGLLEGEFPTVKTSTGFLTAQELQQWHEIGVHIYNPRTESGFEYALFASLINRASEKLILSYPSIEITSNKEELLPSFFFNALDLNPQSTELISFDKGEYAFTSPANALASALWQDCGQAQSVAGRSPLIKNFIEQIQEKLTFAQIRSKQLAQSPVNGYLVDHVAASNTRVILPEYWSASHLNDYGKCPFSFWLSRMLKIRPHEEPDIGLSIPDRGTFYHKALELFYQKVIEDKILFVPEQKNNLKEIFNKAVNDAFIWLEKEKWFRPTEFWPQEKNALKFSLDNFFEAEYERFAGEAGQYQPLLVEAVFAPDSQYQPLVLNKNGKTIKIRGKIDRIDIEQNSFGNAKKLRLIDYKSGSTFISRDDFESGRNMQLPIYALAAEESILPGSAVNSIQYLSISTGKVLSGKKQDEISIHEDLHMLKEKIFSFVESIEQGDFSVRPSNADKVCPACIHKTICRVKEFPK